MVESVPHPPIREREGLAWKTRLYKGSCEKEPIYAAQSAIWLSAPHRLVILSAVRFRDLITGRQAVLSAHVCTAVKSISTGGAQTGSSPQESVLDKKRTRHFRPKSLIYIDLS